MLHPGSIGSIALGAVLCIALAGARAHDESKYPDWSGQWRRPAGVGNQWDTSRPPRQGQAPLTAEYQAIYEANLKDQAAGGQGTDPTYTCIPDGHAAGDERDLSDGNHHPAEDHLHADRIFEHAAS